ncbi:diacylglycerol kinase [Devosia pacifica]|uniref:Diacylglycerol kinase n=1 Tax=Devosia pacifica TaxID=1335967 RepID=A0A918SEB0_9HYPH|nr:diacylglycerol kinase family protein [Devosia pacifica]GHA36042.1 diacylglycerol kinase [Devosia pacifica]
MKTQRYYVILNARSGTAESAGVTPIGLEQSFSAIGAEATIDVDFDAPLVQRIDNAIASGAPCIVAAGGDGTVTAVAEKVARTDRVMAILPLGTLNALARDLEIPFQIDAWFAALGDMQPHRIDVGWVNGRVFLHKVFIGVVPSIAAARERMRGRKGIGAFVGFTRYLFRRLWRARRMVVEIAPQEGEPHLERVHALAVSNNAYAEGAMRVFSRQSLDGGSLMVYAIRHLRIMDFLRLGTGMLLGHWQQDRELRIESVRAVTIKARNKRLHVMLDGEIESLQTPLEFSITPRALAILAPPSQMVHDQDPDSDQLETVA